MQRIRKGLKGWRSLLTLVTLATSVSLSAQRFFFENVGVEKGLPSVKVYTAVQDSFGTVWIGTGAGLASYDGNDVVNHGTQEGVASNGARALLVDRDGRLWVGHLDGGVTLFDGQRFRSFTVGSGIQRDITAVIQDREGAIWIATAGQGAWRLGEVPEEGGTIAAQHVGTEEGLQEKLLSATLLSDGRLCFLEDGGSIRYLKDGRAVELPLPGIQGVFDLSAFFEDSRKALWVGTQGGGAFRIEPGGKRMDRFDPSSGMGSATVYCFGEDNNGAVWIGTTDGGVSVVDKAGLRTFDTRNGLHSRFVRCVSRDREGNLLLGTNDAGLDIFKGDRFVSFGEADGLADPQVYAVMEDRNGRIWFGTNSGIVILTERNGTSSFETIIDKPGQPSTGFVRCLRQDEQGSVWVGTENAGLIQYDPRTSRAQSDIEVNQPLGGSKVTALEIGQMGEVWVGGINGLIRYLPGSGTVPTIYTEAEGLANNSVNAIYRDNGGTIWVGSTAKGVTRIDNGQPKAIDLGRAFTATAFTQDSDGRLWVGTEGQGIIVLQNGKEVQRFTTAEGLLSNTIRALGVDQLGHVWIGTNKGLNKWRPKKGGFIAFTVRAGFTGIEVKPNAVWTTRKGDVWFGTVNGATRVGNEKGDENSVPPLVSVRGWKVNTEDRPLEDNPSLGHTDRSVRIIYSSVALSDPDAVRYMYMLGGLDEDWQPITTETDAYYPALPPGKYQFKVKAMDRSGVWTDPPAEYDFTILPPWYRSWWFYTALVVFVGAILFSYIKVRERQLRLQNLVLEQKVVERTAEVVAQSKEIEGQKGQIEGLLLNILPKEISEELKINGKATARRHADVTVMFTDMKGFTKVAEKMTPEELVNELDECFISFDEIIGRYGIEKIKTIGDSYMCACGVPTQDPHHGVKTVLAALEIRELMERWRQERLAKGKEPWVLRIGSHTGPVVAGVVGRRKFAYDIWGDTVNTASRMESSGAPGEVNISGATYVAVKDYFECEHRGQVEAKNKGAIDMYFVRRIKAVHSADKNGMLPSEALLRAIGLDAAAQQRA